MRDLFYFPKGVTVARSVDDTTPYSLKKDLQIKEIDLFSEVLFKSFDFKYIKIKSVKGHLLFSENDNVIDNTGDHTIISENKNDELLQSWTKLLRQNRKSIFQ